MSSESESCKLPVVLGIILCSFVAVVFVTFIEAIELSGSAWVHEHRAVPFIARTFKDYYLFGMILPLFTAGAGIWFLVGKSLTVRKFAWMVLVLVGLHLFWISYAAAAFYLANQTFH